MDIIVRGESHELDFVRRICRDKVTRGILAILPGTGPASNEVVQLRKERDEAKAVITTLQEHVNAIEQDRERMCNAQIELAELLGLVLSIAVQHRAEVPKDITAKCAKFGIIVPKIEDTAEKEGESVPENAEMPENPADSVPESDNPELMDDKHIGELEDLQEVDLDADDKTPVTDDSKNVPEADVKKAEAPKKASKRSKKSE